MSEFWIFRGLRATGRQSSSDPSTSLGNWRRWLFKTRANLRELDLVAEQHLEWAIDWADVL